MAIFRTLVAATLLAAAFVYAPLAAGDVRGMDNIIVTATRTEITVSDATVPVTVISREDIELSLANDLSELLRFQAGLDIGRNGGPGQASSVFLRGTESNHTLVLVDGVRVNPGTIGGAPLQHIAPESIERIEIVKGARSALYGSDAVGGVVNIITRRADDSYAEFALGGGSFDTRSGNLSAGARREQGELGITLNYAETDGFSPRVQSELDRGYDNFSANVYGSRRFGNSEVSLRHWRAEGNVEYLDFFLSPVDQDFENTVTALQFDSTLGESGRSQLIVSHMSDSTEQSQSTSFVESERLSLDWQYTQSVGVHTLTGGVYLMEEDAEALSFGLGFDEKTRVNAVFLQDQIQLERHRAVLAARLTDHETFGNEVTWNAEYAFDLNPDWVLSAGVGRAFRAPDATDRFGFGGNPELEAETSEQLQLGVRYLPGERHSIEFELYANDIDNLIEFDSATSSLRNIAEAEIRGAELAWEYTGEHFTLRTALVNQRAEDKASGNRLLRRAEESLSFNYTQNLGKHRVGLSALVSGDREDFGGVELDSYVLVNLSAEFALGRNLTLNARIENLTDEEYQTAANFNMQERSGFVELRFHGR